ncbi:MAG: non-heme iron oxygenase ferredoxin subunit [Armatimonadetes bacterium]|nr:non-heme iron oxygenase ferredoxin subunit [Armatimonadota bacterium]
MGEWIRVGKKEEIPINGAKVVVVEDMPIAVFRVGEDEFYAIEDTCTHDEASLAEGWFADQYLIECPRHGARFDIRTGKAVRMPAVYPVKTFAVKIEGDEVFVEWSNAEGEEERWGIHEKD